jgi:glucosyl-3-phosphoglycerate synthase
MRKTVEPWPGTGASVHILSDIDVDGVCRRIHASRRRVSVVIPARDEEETIEAIVSSIDRLCVADLGIVREIVVVDGGSSDRTAERARRAGAKVVDQRRVLPDVEEMTGKGDALWKGLAVTGGDPVVFVDADIMDFDPAWVVALAAPLVLDGETVLAKACYERPTDDGGGGRVTELLARPLLNAFWPDLARIVQPLAGEYAGRRHVLEGVRFVSGYGVEFGLLVDIASHHGAGSIAQVDLGTRTHAHQSLTALGRMAAEILSVAASRLREEGRLRTDVADTFVQPRRDTTGQVGLETHAVPHAERPPLAKRQRCAPGPCVESTDG